MADDKSRGTEPSDERGSSGTRRKTRRSGYPVLADDFVFDYKDVTTLRYFITDRGRIVPRRISGLSATQQRELARAIKRARNIALLPYTGNGK